MSGCDWKTFWNNVATWVDIPPGLKGTITFIGFSGYSAFADCNGKTAMQVTKNINKNPLDVHVLNIFYLLSCWSFVSRQNVRQ
jgi:hypothetical protein